MAELTAEERALLAADYDYAGFWRRFAAWFLDQLIVGAIWTLIAYVAAGGDWDAAVQSDPEDLLGLVGTWLYYALQESGSAQATIGKRVMGVIVTDLEGRRISFARATGRFFGQILSAMILLIGFIMIAFTARKQGLHDLMASTLVLHRTSPADGLDAPAVRINEPR